MSIEGSNRDHFQEIMLKDDMDDIFRNNIEISEVVIDGSDSDDPVVLLLAGYIDNCGQIFGDDNSRTIELIEGRYDTLVILKCINEVVESFCIRKSGVAVMSERGRLANGDEVEQIRLYFNYANWDAATTALLVSQLPR